MLVIVVKVPLLHHKEREWKITNSRSKIQHILPGQAFVLFTHPYVAVFASTVSAVMVARPVGRTNRCALTLSTCSIGLVHSEETH